MLIRKMAEMKMVSFILRDQNLLPLEFIRLLHTARAEITKNRKRMLCGKHKLSNFTSSAWMLSAIKNGERESLCPVCEKTNLRPLLAAIKTICYGNIKLTVWSTER